MPISEDKKRYIRELLIAGKKIEAVRFIKKDFGLSLVEAKRLIDLVDITIADTEYKYVRNLRKNRAPKKIIGLVFTFVGFAMLGGAMYEYISNEEFIQNGVRGKATVISNPSQPDFEYIFEGQSYQYQSTIESSPPSYHIGEQVDIFINPQYPSDILVDSFTDRWLIIVILGSMGGIFFLIGVFAMMFGKKKVIGG